MVDLTKPLRFKDSKGRCYPVLGVVDEWNRQAIVVGNPWHHYFVPIASLENVPEPVHRWAVITLDSEGRITHYSKPYPAGLSERARQYSGALIKLTRTEDGKTHVEVIDG